MPIDSDSLVRLVMDEEEEASEEESKGWKLWHSVKQSDCNEGKIRPKALYPVVVRCLEEKCSDVIFGRSSMEPKESFGAKDPSRDSECKRLMRHEPGTADSVRRKCSKNPEINCESEKLSRVRERKEGRAGVGKEDEEGEGEEGALLRMVQRSCMSASISVLLLPSNWYRRCIV